MYLKQIEQLVVLQKVDDEIVLLQDELKRAPEQIIELEKRRQDIEDSGWSGRKVNAPGRKNSSTPGLRA